MGPKVFAAAQRLVAYREKLDLLGVYCPRKPGEIYTEHAATIAIQAREDDCRLLAHAFADLFEDEAAAKHRAERAVDNLDCALQLGLTPEQRETAIMNVYNQMRALVRGREK